MREMKDSGVEWIGEIPADWKVIKNKYLLSLLYSGGTPSVSNNDFYCVEGGTPFVSISDMSTVDYVLSTQKRLTDSGLKDKNLKILPIGTILYSIYATVGAVSELKIEAAISQAMLALQVNSKVDKSFYKYNLAAMKDYIFSNANGNTQFNLNAEKVKNFYFVLPNVATQHHIANYLDRKCAEIDAIIAKQQQIIEKLKEYKLSVITEAVTKGLDPNVPMKDSGVEWIGMVPEEWRISRIKYICEFNPGTKKANHDVVSYAPMECVKDGYLIKKEIRHDGISTGLTSFEEGDIIMAKVTPCFENGNIAIAKDLVNKFGVGSSELFVFRAKKVNTQWLFYFLRNSIFKKLAEATMTGTGGLKRVSPSFIRDFSLALPPEKEQRRIIEYLDKKCMEIDRVIKYKQSAVEKLGQYKKSLIYEVVTGKMEHSCNP